MTDLDLTAMCDAAMLRLHHRINRSVGQHMRALREQGRTMTPAQQRISDWLYCGYMADQITDDDVRQACALFDITYPPELNKGFQATFQEPVIHTLKDDHGIYCN